MVFLNINFYKTVQWRTPSFVPNLQAVSPSKTVPGHTPDCLGGRLNEYLAPRSLNGSQQLSKDHLLYWETGPSLQFKMNKNQEGEY